MYSGSIKVGKESKPYVLLTVESWPQVQAIYKEFELETNLLIVFSSAYLSPSFQGDIMCKPLTQEAISLEGRVLKSTGRSAF